MTLLALVLAVGMPFIRGQHDETGLAVSWLTTPAAAALLGSALGASLVSRILVAIATAAIVALTISVATYVVWRSWAEPWMLLDSGMVVAMLLVSIICEILGALWVVLFIPARAKRTVEIEK